MKVAPEHVRDATADTFAQELVLEEMAEQMMKVQTPSAQTGFYDLTAQGGSPGVNEAPVQTEVDRMLRSQNRKVRCRRQVHRHTARHNRRSKRTWSYRRCSLMRTYRSLMRNHRSCRWRLNMFQCPKTTMC